MRTHHDLERVGTSESPESSEAFNAFYAVFRRKERRLRYMCSRSGIPEQDHEDVLQETLLELWKYSESSTHGETDSLIWRIHSTSCAQYWRKRNLQKNESIESQGGVYRLEMIAELEGQFVEQQELRTTLSLNEIFEIAGIDDKKRQMFILKHGEELREKEIAKIFRYSHTSNVRRVNLETLREIRRALGLDEDNNK